MMMNMKDGWRYAAGAMTLSVDLHAAIAAASCLRGPEKNRWTVLCRAEAGGTELWDRGQVRVPVLGHVPDPSHGDFVLYLYLFLQLNEASIEKKCFMSENKV